MKKQLPVLRTDEEAEDFVATADLMEYDLSVMVPVRFEFAAKSAHINMRVPEALLTAVKEKARTRGIPFTRYIRSLIEADIAKPSGR